MPAAQASNLLANRGFESGTEFPWVRFNGGGLHTTNDFYAGSATPVSVYDGTYVSQTYGSSEYNGIFQDLPATNGEIFTADGWFLMAAEDPLSGSNTCWLEVQFLNASGAPVGLYRSFMIDANFPTSTWINVDATNRYALDFVTLLGSAKYLVAPAGTAKVRYQVVLHALGGTGSIWYDDMSLFLKVPVRITPSIVGGNIRLSFATQIGVNYQVLWRDDLMNNTWQMLNSRNDGHVISPDEY